MYITENHELAECNVSLQIFNFILVARTPSAQFEPSSFRFLTSIWLVFSDIISCPADFRLLLRRLVLFDGVPVEDLR